MVSELIQGVTEGGARGQALMPAFVLLFTKYILHL